MSNQEQEDLASAESARVRLVFEERDRRAGQSAAMLDAYRRINADRIRHMRELVARLFGESVPSILDVGCGSGYDLARWLEAGWPAARLTGVDLVEGRIAAAREACPGVRLEVNDGTDLHFPDASFDLTTAVTVFSSILNVDVRRSLFREMWRVTKPGGAVMVYDFVIRNPRNRHVRAMGRSRLRELGARPAGSIRLTPLIYMVALGSAIHPMLADVVSNVAPRTHRLTWWRKPPRPDVRDGTVVLGGVPASTGHELNRATKDTKVAAD